MTCVIVLQQKYPLAISKWRKVENLENAFYVFLRFFTFFYVFFDMTLQKRKKARFFGF